MEKVGYLDKVPYLLARLHEPGVRARCLDQFGLVDPDGHHRLTRWFLDADHPDGLRQDVDRMHEDGSGMSDRLAAAVQSLSWVPMDDCVCEGPHAATKRLKMPASAAKWTWVASSMRLQQNIEDCRRLPEEVGTSIRASWSSYASVLQPPHMEGVFPRIKPSVFERRLYRIEHLLPFQIPKGRNRGSVAIAFGRRRR